MKLPLRSDKPIVLGAVWLIASVACSSNAQIDAAAEYGKPCGTSGSGQCGNGTSCMAFTQPISGGVSDSGADAGAPGCTASTQACNIGCQIDNDCATKFGPGFSCINGCNGLPKTCFRQPTR